MNFAATAKRRKLLFAALYLSEGAPIGFIWWALPTRLREAGLSLTQITGLTSILVLPWTLKFLWAPLIDVLRTPRFTRRSWILGLQLTMGLTLLPLARLDPVHDFTLLMPLLLVHACAAATQDVAIDALAISLTGERERGTLNGVMQAGMLVGRSLFGGGALLLARRLGDAEVIYALTAVVWGSSLLLIASRAPEESGPVALTDRARAFAAQLGAAARHRSTWLGLAFAALGGAGFEAVGAVAGPFLIDRGADSTQVGVFFAVPSVLCMLAGALLGGYLADRLARRTAAGCFLVAFASAVLAIAAADTILRPAPVNLLFLLLAALYVTIGLFTAASYALFMDLTDPRLGATQFSAFMGATNACESGSAFAVGRLASAWGYPIAFSLGAILSLATLPLLAALRPTTGAERTPAPAAPAAGGV